MSRRRVAPPLLCDIPFLSLLHLASSSVHTLRCAPTGSRLQCGFYHVRDSRSPVSPVPFFIHTHVIPSRFPEKQSHVSPITRRETRIPHKHANAPSPVVLLRRASRGSIGGCMYVLYRPGRSGPRRRWNAAARWRGGHARKCASEARHYRCAVCVLGEG